MVKYLSPADKRLFSSTFNSLAASYTGDHFSFPVVQFFILKVQLTATVLDKNILTIIAVLTRAVVWLLVT